MYVYMYMCVYTYIYDHISFVLVKDTEKCMKQNNPDVYEWAPTRI